MPSDVKGAPDRKGSVPGGPQALDATSQPTHEIVVEPPSAKLIVRLFVIPLAIVAVAVGVMFLIGLLAGQEPSFEQAMAQLRAPGGGRTANLLVGPGSKQRWMNAEVLVKKMKTGMGEAERVALADQLIDVLKNHTTAEEGMVRHFLLLALGRVWRQAPGETTLTSDAAVRSRDAVVRTLLEYVASSDLQTRKAAILATAFLAGQPEARDTVPLLIARLRDGGEDLDVRLAAATVLGPLGFGEDRAVIDALETATREGDPRNSELIWASSLSLAQLGRGDVEETILMLLSRSELSELSYYDREADPSNPVFRKLSELEKDRFLINTIEGAKRMKSPRVRERIEALAQSDPSGRVRFAAKEALHATTLPSVAPIVTQ